MPKGRKIFKVVDLRMQKGDRCFGASVAFKIVDLGDQATRE
jgi:hypothetical protein